MHAAVKEIEPDLEGLRFGSIYADDGGNQCYIKDAARGIALLQTADKVSQPVYNVSSGQPTSNRQIVDAIRKVIPGFEIELPSGHMPGVPEDLWYFDINKLWEDTGYVPQYTIKAGIADYIDWLRAGNLR